METRGLNHIHIAVRDLQRSIRFYSQAFGFQEAHAHDDLVFLVKPGTSDVVTLRLEDSERVGQCGGIDHFGFLLMDPAQLEAAISEIERAGGKLIERTEIGGGIPSAFVADPDGYRIQI